MTHLEDGFYRNCVFSAFGLKYWKMHLNNCLLFYRKVIFSAFGLKHWKCTVLKNCQIRCWKSHKKGKSGTLPIFAWHASTSLSPDPRKPLAKISKYKNAKFVVVDNFLMKNMHLFNNFEISMTFLLYMYISYRVLTEFLQTSKPIVSKRAKKT